VRGAIIEAMEQQYGESPKDAWIDSALRLLVSPL